MPALTPAQARVVDPVLSTVAQGYQNNEMVAGNLFPVVPVGLRGGNIITFGKEAFMLYGSQRAPGENTKRVAFGYAGAPYALVDYSLEGVVPSEVSQEAANGPGIDLGQGAIFSVSAIMALRLEKQAADIARNAASYAATNKSTKSGTSQWSDFSGVSDPIADIETAKEAIRAATGKRPNTIVMGASVMAKLRQHPKVIDRIKYTGRDVATPELLASLFGVARVVVGDAIYSNDAGTAFTDVWGKDVVVAYTEIGSMASNGLPSYGYTYQLNGYPMVEEPYYDRSAKSWVYPVTRVEAPVLASASAGYLITNAVA
jgi:Phage major capsid protein E